jgi:hypothetical protein
MDPLQALVTTTFLPNNLSRSQLREIIVENNRQIGLLKLENHNLRVENERLRNENASLILIIEGNKKTIELLREENKKLNDRISALEKELKEVKDELKIQTQWRIRFDALVKLNECNALVNKEFRKRYEDKLGRKTRLNVGDYIKNEPEGKLEGEMWAEFCNDYPGIKDENFRDLYYDISSNRAGWGAHKNVSRLSKGEFDGLMKIAFDDYEENRKLYEEYREFLYMFPA